MARRTARKARRPSRPSLLPAVRAHGTDGTSGLVEGARAIKAGETLLCRFIRPEDVPADHRAMIRRHVDRACELSGFDPGLGIRWYTIATGPTGDFAFTAKRDNTIPGGRFAAGQVDWPLVIDLYAGLRGPLAVSAAVHEARHAMQKLAIAALEDPGYRERDADAFVTGYMAKEIER